MKAKWTSQGKGIQMGSENDGTNKPTFVAFADDTTLLASSKEDLEEMVKDIQGAFAAHGLKLNLDKYKIKKNHTD